MYVFREYLRSECVGDLDNSKEELFGKAELSPTLDLQNTISLVIVQNPCQVKFSRVHFVLLSNFPKTSKQRMVIQSQNMVPRDSNQARIVLSLAAQASNSSKEILPSLFVSAH